MAEIRRIGVLGLGLMGHGIAQVTAQAGYEVVVCELDEATLTAGIAKIEAQLERAVQRRRLESGQRDAILARVMPGHDYAALADCDLVIEAITEDLSSKLEMWRQVDALVQPQAFFASNTSSLPVIAQAAATSRPDRFLGLHFFNPPQVMKLLEVVRCVTTSPEALAVGLELGERLGKQTVQTKDTAGFIVNRLLVPYLLDAIRALEEGVGSIAELDDAMKAGAGYPMGPLTLADFVGLDTLGSIANVMFEEFAERRFAQPPTLRKMLAAGWHGRKSGIGFYDYSGAEPVPNAGLA